MSSFPNEKSKKRLSPNSTIKDLIRAKFGTSDKAKFNPKSYSCDLASLFFSGQTSIIEEILSRHNENPYQNQDEIIGDLQILLMEQWNEFRKLYPLTSKPLTLEQILDNNSDGLIHPKLEKTL